MPFLVSDSTRVKLEDLIRDRGNAPGASGRPPSNLPPGVQLLCVQAGASNTFGYPARIQKWDNATGANSDLNTTEVRVKDANGNALAAGDYVVARSRGINSSGVACFIGSGVVAFDGVTVGDGFLESVSGVSIINFSPSETAYVTDEGGGEALVTLLNAGRAQSGLLASAPSWPAVGYDGTDPLRTRSYFQWITGSKVFGGGLDGGADTTYLAAVGNLVVMPQVGLASSEDSFPDDSEVQDFLTGDQCNNFLINNTATFTSGGSLTAQLIGDSSFNGLTTFFTLTPRGTYSAGVPGGQLTFGGLSVETKLEWFRVRAKWAYLYESDKVLLRNIYVYDGATETAGASGSSMGLDFIGGICTGIGTASGTIDGGTW